MDLNELLAKRANVWEQMKAIDADAAAEGRAELNAEERQKWDAADKELETLSGAIERKQKLNANAVATADLDGSSDERSDETATPEARYEEAFGSYLRGGMGNLTPEQRQIFADGYRDLEGRAQAVGTNSAGGYLAPVQFRNELIKRLKDFGAVQNVAQVITTDSGATLSWPTMDDTSNVGAILAENTQMSEQDVTLGTANLDAYVYSSKLTRASYQLINDSAVDVPRLIIDAHGERLARILNQHFTTGTGSSQPDGIVTGAASGVTAAGVAAITADEIIDLVHSVDPAYRSSGRAKFMLSDTALKLLRKLKASGTGEYLFQPNAQAGVAPTLFGYEYVVNNDMAVPATGVKSVLFGDFYAGYIIRIVQGVQVITFNERYADYLQTAWSSYMRADGTVQSTNAYKALTQA